MSDISRELDRYKNHTWADTETENAGQVSLPRRVYRKLKQPLYDTASQQAQIAELTDRINRLERQQRERIMEDIIPSDEELARQREDAAKPGRFTKDMVFSIIVPLYNTPENLLRDMIASVREQTYTKWELCLADGSEDSCAYVGEMCKFYAELDDRIKYTKLKENKGISENTNECIKISTGNYMALLDHDDLLHPSALYECACEIERSGADFVYTDEMTFITGALSQIAARHYKPDFSPRTMRGVNYICHLSVFSRELMDDNGLYRKECDGSQDHDMILRLTDKAKHVAHIQKILYFWRVHPGSTSGNNIGSKSYAVTGGKRAITDAEKNAGFDVDVDTTLIAATHYRVKYKIADYPKVAVWVIGKDASTIEAAKQASYSDFTVESVSSVAELDARIKASDALYHAFLCAGSKPTDNDWITNLVPLVMHQSVGIAAGRTIDEDGIVAEAGYITGLGDLGVALPILRGARFDEPGYYSRMYYVHNVGAVSLQGAMISKAAYEAVGGFSASLTSVKGLGIDFSLALRKAEYEVALEPYVLFEAEKKGMEDILRDAAGDYVFILADKKEILAAGDPYYNSNLRKDGSFEPIVS